MQDINDKIVLDAIFLQLFCKTEQRAVQVSASRHIGICAHDTPPGRFSQVFTGGVHTLTCRTHIFLRTAHSLRTSHIFMRVTYTHGSSVCKKVFAHVSFLSVSPSPFSCLTRLCCSHGHFETTPDYDFTDDPIHTSLPNFPVLKAHDAHQRSEPQFLRLLENPRARTLENSVFTQCLNPLFRTFLMMILLFTRKQRKHAIGKPLLDREKGKEEKVL